MLWSERRRRIGRGDHSPLPREAAIGQLAGHTVVEAVVRCLTHSDQIPAAPLPAGEIFHRVDVVGNGGQLVPAEPCGLSASVLVTPEHRVAQVQPAFALVIHGQNKKRHDLTTEIMALMSSGYHLGCKTKAPNDSPFSRSNHLALALTRWFWLWLIFTIDSRLHSLQYSGKSVSTVVGRTRCCVGRPHNGQINFPSADTNSISRRFSDCKPFCRSFPVFIYCFKSKI